MDVAASEFLKDGKYDLDFKTKDNDGSKMLTGKWFRFFFVEKEEEEEEKEEKRQGKELTFSQFFFLEKKKI